MLENPIRLALIRTSFYYYNVFVYMDYNYSSPNSRL
jgi:hypothetical protein